MRKIIWLSLMVLCLPMVGMAQNNDDDLYYTPKKKDPSAVNKHDNVRTTGKQTSVYVTPGTTVVVKEAGGHTRDVDEYNRRYTSYDNELDELDVQNETEIVEEGQNADAGAGEWIDDFNGTQDDYEYAMRLIRFRNPNFAVSVNSPLYWDMIYGMRSWDWNVYNDGFYAYAFPTFSNSLWFDWRFGNFGMSWNYPYNGWGGYYPGYWGSSWGHHHHGWYDHCYGNNYRGKSYYYDNRPVRYTQSRPGSSSVRPSLNTRPSASNMRPDVGFTRSNTGREVSSRPTGSSVRPGSINTSGTINRPSSGLISTEGRPSYSRPSGSTVSGRPSSSSVYEGASRPSYTRPSGEGVRSSSTYSRPSSTRNSSSYSNESSSSSYNRSSSTYSRPSNNSSNRSSYSSPSSSSRSSSSSYSGGGGSSSRPSSGGGGSSRGGRR